MISVGMAFHCWPFPVIASDLSGATLNLIISRTDALLAREQVRRQQAGAENG